MADLEPTDRFLDRHIGPSPAEQAKMLSELGYTTLDELTTAAVPALIRSDSPLALPSALGESATTTALRGLADRNRVVPSLIGLGYHGTVTPPVIQRNVLEDPSWYTAYTPYQPEISQGRLEALLNFQTMVSDLTGMDLANASLLDEPTAAAEAMAMARRLAPKDSSSRFVVDEGCHPHTIAVVQTRAEPLGIEVEVGDAQQLLSRGSAPFAVLVQTPTTTGEILDLHPLSEAVHETGGLVIAATDLLACCLVVPPGEHGADIVVGSAQRFGVPLGFGGPHAGFIATRTEFARSLPGRLVGVSKDDAGRTAFRLALQTREAAHPSREGHEQHLHRAGAARGRRIDVRRVPRARRTASHRVACPCPRRRIRGCRGNGPWRRCRARGLFRHSDDTHRGPIRCDRRGRAGTWRQRSACRR